MYHSKFNDGDLMRLPLRKCCVPGPELRVQSEDIIDEAIDSFRINIYFKNFEVRGGADKILMYLTLWIQRCISEAEQCQNEISAKRRLQNLAYSLGGPHTTDFPPALAPFNYDADPDIAEYLRQLRMETWARLQSRCRA
eukprot:GEMP01048538.1.p1 GENE.GEMP01048538.1~~GEMP01048538.1.p1  ORF type:complete len:139 (-),score=22.13 GEMP01048538.1:1171-1587(-)